jgi:N-methylhydantoinase A
MTAELAGGRLAVDIGGTFTDVVHRSAGGAVRTTKVPTTLDDVAGGIQSGIESIGASPQGLDAFVHGTTIVLNALLEGKTPAVGLITTKGFRDVLEIMRTNRPDMYDLQQEKPVPLVPRRWRREVGARMTYTGESLVDVDPEEVRAIGHELAAAGVVSVAVCLLNAYANPEHEQAIAEALRETFPEAAISLSSDISREWREFERTSTTVINSAAKPVVSLYLGELEAALAEREFEGQLLMMQSNGGVTSVDDARRKPVATLMSGPVGGVAAAIGLVRGHGSLESCVTLDIGGTSADVAILDRGEPVTRALGQIGAWPVMVPMIDVQSIGAGGGSIARVDPFGALLVGPESAGAIPGPACYARGGTCATVTDANLLLGRLNPSYFAGGELELDVAAARSAIQASVANHYGMTPAEAALGIVTVIDSTMTRLLWEVMIGRGYDPREFALVAFGGAGPLHACALAAALGIREVVVPPGPGTFSAYGMVAADIRHDLDRMVLGAGPATDEELAIAFAELEHAALAQIESQHARYERVEFRRFAELRYAGQHHPLPIELPVPADGSVGILAPARRAFHEKHERLYGFRRDDTPVELLRLQLSAIGKVQRLNGVPGGVAEDSAGRPTEHRPLYLDGAFCEAPVYHRSDLGVGSTFAGPCVIEEATSTTYLAPDFSLEVDAAGNLRIAAVRAGGTA